MEFLATEIPDVKLIRPRVFGDERGFFMETFRESLFAEQAIPRFVQDNHSRSKRAILRGIHYQIRQPQGKLVRVTWGAVFDVAVDLRQNSPTFGKWVGEVLSEENKHMLWVPAGFGHAFYVLSESADFLYKCTDYWAPEHERTIRWDDPDLGVRWPLIDGLPPIVSDKDAAGVSLREAECF